MMGAEARPTSGRAGAALVVAIFVATLLRASLAAALAPGVEAPAIDVHDTVGRRFSLAALRGDFVLISFSGTRAEAEAALPGLDALAREHADLDLHAVAIVRARERAEVAALAARHDVTFPVIWDSRNSIARRYELRDVPAAFVIDPAGVIRHVHAGPWSRIAPAIHPQLRALLGLHGSRGSPMTPLTGH